MGVFSNIQRALDTRLNQLIDRPFIAWPNTKFAPTAGASYIRPTLIQAKSELYTLNDVHMNQGIYQIDIYVPLEKGLNSALSLMDAIAEHFEEERSLVVGDDTVHIQQITPGDSERQDAWYRVYLEINYLCYS